MEGAGDNCIEEQYYEEYAKSLVAVVRVVKEHTDIDLYTLSVQNEPQFKEQKMETSVTIFKQVQELIIPLDAEERLRLIEVIAAAPTPRASERPPRADQLTREQAAWYALPPAARAPYRGEYVAISQGQVVDHDPDQRALYLRIRQRYGTTPVALLRADWDEPPTFLIRSPRLERAE